MGSVLAIYLATKFQFSGVAFVATVLKFNNEFKIRILNTIFHTFFPKIDKRKVYDSKIRDTLDYYGYDVYPMTGLNEMRKLTNIVKPILKHVTSPALIICSERDVVSPRENFDIVCNTISSTIKETLILEKSTHNIFVKSAEQQMVLGVFKEGYRKGVRIIDVDASLTHEFMCPFVRIDAKTKLLAKYVQQIPTGVHIHH